MAPSWREYAQALGSRMLCHVITRPVRSASLRADTSFGYQLLPLDDVPRDQLAQMLRRAADHGQSLFGEIFDDLWLTKNLVDFLVVAFADCGRHPCRRENTEPKLDLDGQAHFDQCRQLGSDGRSFPTRNRQKTNLIALHERQSAVKP
jgi:hypothetical protein